MCGDHVCINNTTLRVQLKTKVINVYFIKISDAMMNFDSLNQNMYVL